MEYKYMPVDKLLWNTRMYPGCVSASESAAELGRRLADAQATVEALRAQLRLANIDQANAEARANDLQQQVEALQRERDRLREALERVLEQWVNGRKVKDGICMEVLVAAKAALTPAGEGRNEIRG